MRDGIVQINTRPIRHAFLVDPTDVDSLQHVIEINTFLWGGKFNSIIPTFQDLPENWYGCDNIIVKSKNMWTLRDGIPQDTFVRAGLPSPTLPAACANNYGYYYNPHDIVSGYLNNFDPDFVVPMGECLNYTLNLGGRKVIDHPSIFLRQDENSLKGYADFYELCRRTRHKHLEIV